MPLVHMSSTYGILSTSSGLMSTIGSRLFGLLVLEVIIGL